MFQKKAGKKSPNAWFRDVVGRSGTKKEHHIWEQNEGDFDSIVRSFSPDNGSVCDPFLGSGSIAISALNAGRKIFGFDIDPKAVETTLHRIEKHLKSS